MFQIDADLLKRLKFHGYGHFSGVERHDLTDLIPLPNNEFGYNEFKKNGNKFNDKKDYRNALIFYNQALCCAAKGSENAGIIYANRSEIALKVKFYPECLKNIQLAREHNYPIKSLSQLMHREKKCQKLMATTDSSEDEYANLVELLHGPVVEPFMIDHKKNGTHSLITNRFLKTGDLIAVQKPFSGIIMDNGLHIYCSNCTKDCVLASILCDECSSVMFCSKECKESATEIHQYECGIIGFLKIEFGCDNLMHLSKCRALFKALSLFNGSADKLKEFLEEPETSEKFTLDICDERKFLKDVNTFQESRDVEFLEYFLSFYPKMKKTMDNPELRNFIIRFISKFSRTAVLRREIVNERNGGYYPIQATMNISCAPNVISIILKDGKVVYIAQKPIKAGEKLTVGIKHMCTFSTETKNERQKEIFDNFQYKCVCVACEKNYPILSNQKIMSTASNYLGYIRSNMAVNLTGIDALKMYKENCKFIDKHFDAYPCREISTTVFTNSLLLRNQSKYSLLKNII